MRKITQKQKERNGENEEREKYKLNEKLADKDGDVGTLDRDG